MFSSLVADIVKVVPKEEVMTDFWPLVDQLGTDNQDNIRVCMRVILVILVLPVLYVLCIIEF